MTRDHKFSSNLQFMVHFDSYAWARVILRLGFIFYFVLFLVGPLLNNLDKTNLGNVRMSDSKLTLIT